MPRVTSIYTAASTPNLEHGNRYRQPRSSRLQQLALCEYTRALLTNPPRSFTDLAVCGRLGPHDDSWAIARATTTTVTIAGESTSRLCQRQHRML